jgi:uncharacterized LabA/DUF88 family protein
MIIQNHKIKKEIKIINHRIKIFYQIIKIINKFKSYQVIWQKINLVKKVNYQFNYKEINRKINYNPLLTMPNHKL